MGKRKRARDPNNPNPRKKLSVAGVAAQVAAHSGNLAAVGRAFGVSRVSVWQYVERHPALKPVVSDARESTKDDVENVLIEKALAGEAWAVCFYLKTQARERGYVERQQHEHSGPGGKPIEQKVTHAPDKAAFLAFLHDLANLATQPAPGPRSEG